MFSVQVRLDVNTSLDNYLIPVRLPLFTPGNVLAELQWKVHPGKVFSLTWCERDLLLSCGPEGHVVRSHTVIKTQHEGWEILLHVYENKSITLSCTVH